MQQLRDDDFAGEAAGMLQDSHFTLTELIRFAHAGRQGTQP